MTHQVYYTQFILSYMNSCWRGITILLCALGLRISHFYHPLTKHTLLCSQYKWVNPMTIVCTTCCIVYLIPFKRCLFKKAWRISMFKLWQRYFSISQDVISGSNGILSGMINAASHWVQWLAPLYNSTTIK